MTNLDIIKYLAYENPTRLAYLLDDICGYVWNDGANERLGIDDSFPSFHKWLYEDASTSHYLYRDNEPEEWSKAINNPSIKITYPDNLVIELPFEGKDPNHMWNTDNNYNVINNAIGEIKLLENVAKTDKYSDSVYNSFRKEVCADCRSRGRCLQSKMAIVECPRFEYYYEV